MNAYKTKVLVVEDVEIAQKIVKHILTQLDCDVSLANTGKITLELVQQQKFQIIFMDLGLPDTNGIALTELIRKTNNNNKNTPIIALTAHSAEERLEAECLAAGVNGFLTKPLTLQTAFEAITKFAGQDIRQIG